MQRVFVTISGVSNPDMWLRAAEHQQPYRAQRIQCHPMSLQHMLVHALFGGFGIIAFEFVMGFGRGVATPCGQREQLRFSPASGRAYAHASMVQGPADCKADARRHKPC
jgi:hypothetical protein